MKKIILVFDKEEYRKKENYFVELFENKDAEVKIYYTKYEDWLIRLVCKWKYTGEILQHILYWFKSFNYGIRIYFSNKTANIICINPIVGIFLGMLNRKKKFNIILCGFLFEPKSNRIYYALRRKLVSIFLSGITEVVVYSKKEVSYYNSMFKSKFVFVPYGIDYNADGEYKGVLPDCYIFSGGRSNRDYYTIIEAFNKLKNEYDIDLCIATRPAVVQNINTENVTILKDVVLETFGSAMEYSKLVVISLIETDISAGHQVLLEALERNKIIIINRINAVEDYVSDSNVIFFESENAYDLLLKMKYVIDNYQNVVKQYSHNKDYYFENYTFAKFIERLIVECK